MKRFFCVLLCCFLLTACTNNSIKDIKPILPDNSVISISYLNITYEAEVLYVDNTLLDLKIISPDELQGIEIKINSSGSKILLDNAVVEYPSKIIMNEFYSLYEAFVAMNTTQPVLKGENIYKYNLNSSEFIITLDNGNNIVSIDADGNKFSIRK